MTEPISPEAPADDATPVVTECVLLGRTIKVSQPNSLQVTLMGRALDRGRRVQDHMDHLTPTDDDAWALVRAIASILDVIEGLIVNPHDRNFVEEAMINGRIKSTYDMQPLLDAVMATAQVEAEVKPNRAARRRK